jgi:hypothetical protein
MKTKKWIIKIAMDNNAWIEKIKMNEVLSFDYATQHMDLWMLPSDIQLQIRLEDDIQWTILGSIGLQSVIYWIHMY